MSVSTIGDHETPPVARTRGLLSAAVVAGPLFYLCSAVQALTRHGFDIATHPLSQLATGDLGWIQQLSFIMTGLGVLALAVARRRVTPTGFASRSVPTLLAGFGVGFIVAGFFPMDPQNGFPVGAPAGTVEMSWHSVVHSTAAAVSFLALAGACIVSLVLAVRQRQAWPAIGHGFVAVVLLLPMSPTESSIQIAVTGFIAFTWVSVTALQLQRSL